MAAAAEALFEAVKNDGRHSKEPRALLANARQLNAQLTQLLDEQQRLPAPEACISSTCRDRRYAVRDKVEDMRGRVRTLLPDVLAATAELKQRAAKLDEESERNTGLSQICAADSKRCEKDCRAGDRTVCAIWSIQYYGESSAIDRGEKAIALAKTACDSGLETGCMMAARIQEDWAKQLVERDARWEAVQARGDELANLAYKLKFAKENLTPTRRTERGIDGMSRYRQGLIRDAYCPARKEFIDAANVAEFNRRARAHCADDPPKDVGVGGIEVTLTNDCIGAFATSC